ncbi:ribonuclease 3-like [Aristolochia californica]|uniref:ribonuclease 3-like n=1 Tax=Aristolochia californica TaxID=171875 RepID=UPI0035E08F60
MATHPALALFVITLASSAFLIPAVDYFRLVLSWPGGFCATNVQGQCCKPQTGYPRSDFLVNRLVPYTGSSPSRVCTNVPFNVNELQSNITDLYNYWPSIRCPTNNGQKLWESVWLQDGRCSGLSIRDFFLRTLTVRSKANVIDVLDWKGILPSNYTTYALSEVERAINEVFGVTTYVDCGSTTNQRILGLHLCIDNTVTNVIPCPTRPVSNCASRVSFDTFRPDQLQERYSSFIDSFSSE